MRRTAGTTAPFFNRVLYEEQAEYYDMVRRVESYTTILRNTCSFGVPEHILKHAFVSLTGLLMLAFHSDELTTRMPALAQTEEGEMANIDQMANKLSIRGSSYEGKQQQLSKP